MCIWRHLSPRIFQTYIHTFTPRFAFFFWFYFYFCSPYFYYLPRNIKILFILQCHFFFSVFLVLLIYCCFMWLSITFFLIPLSSFVVVALFYVIFFQLYDIPRLLLFSFFIFLAFQCWFFLELFCCCLSSSLFRCCLEGAIYVYCDGGWRGSEKKKVEIINRTFCLLSLALSLYFLVYSFVRFLLFYHNSKAYMWPLHPPRTKTTNEQKKSYFFIKKNPLFCFWEKTARK